MIKLLLAAVFGMGLLSLALSGTLQTASAAPAFEDPQVCLNGKLLMVEPTTAPIEAWLNVGPGVRVDFNVTHCAGDPALPVFAADHISHTQTANWATLSVKTKKHTDVSVLWNGKTYTYNTGRTNWIFVTRRIN